MTKSFKLNPQTTIFSDKYNLSEITTSTGFEPVAYRLTADRSNQLS
jgi:hypothetical protein